ncbi:MAG: 1-deoxy-D-xylulose-5-phosphate reductoisomerase [Ruminococcaceae bacterium]|nr:1-deoxy-D-xylulose-5-phosphate reductoisomerase [Oscillospiraceae bacterium]
MFFLKRLTILGSTGSIGTQALSVARHLGWEIVALSCHRNAALALEQVKEFAPRYLVVTDETAYRQLEGNLPQETKLLTGTDSLEFIAGLPENDIVLNSLVGMIGLKPTLAAIDAGTNVALANKETLVVGGQIVMSRAKEKGVKILPVDSEHSAIFQCLLGAPEKALNKIILTASGGPFFGKDAQFLRQVTPQQALKHPNWSMGAKITIDSASLMNKGLELIEAVWLFGVTEDQIEIVVHRQSVVHSLVEFCDYSVLAQLGVPDMKIPIQLALTFPQRIPCEVGRLSLTDYGTLTFDKPDTDLFTAIPAARYAIRKGGTAPAALNGANEEAVGLFLAGKLGFTRIAELAQLAAEAAPVHAGTLTVTDVLEADAAARELVRASL